MRPEATGGAGRRRRRVWAVLPTCNEAGNLATVVRARAALELGSRYAAGGRIENRGPHRRLLSAQDE